MNAQIFFYFFIENLCFCSLKIAVCAPKIPIGRKKLKIPIRLKITEWSKNYGLKIPVRVRVCVRMYARAYDCQDSTSGTSGTHTNGTHDHRKREDLGKTEKPVYICMFAGNEKKYKKVKKNLEI